MFPCCKLVNVPKPVQVQLPRKKSSRSYQCVSLHYCSFKPPTAFYSCRNKRISSCCVMCLGHIHFQVFAVCAVLVDLLSWVFVKQVRSTAAGNFSLLLNGPTHNSSIFFCCVRQQPGMLQPSVTKQIAAENGHNSGFYFRGAFISSLLLYFNAVLNDIRSLSWHILTLFMAERLPCRYPSLCQCILNHWPCSLASAYRQHINTWRLNAGYNIQKINILRCSHAECVSLLVY